MQRQGWFAYHEAEILTFGLQGDFKVSTNAGNRLKTIPLKFGNGPKGSFDYLGNQPGLSFAQQTLVNVPLFGNNSHAYFYCNLLAPVNNKNPFLISFKDASGDLRHTDGSFDGTNDIYSFTGGSIHHQYSWNLENYYQQTQYTNSTVTTLTTDFFTGYLPTQAHRYKALAVVGQLYVRNVGAKAYELKDHLGNIRATVSDCKIDGPLQANMTAELLSANNYYPFGMLMPGRSFQLGNYRYGYNTQEKTDEIAGAGNHTAAEFWEYDTRLGRRWNQDPKPNPSISNYACFANNPIWFSDLKGDTIIINGANKSSFSINTTAVNSTINLSDYGLDHDFKENFSMGLNDLKPDAIGVDLSVTGSAVLNKSYGLNLIWHTRGEKRGDVAYPELHLYEATGASASVGVNANVGLIFGWATNSNGTHASNDFVANGVNWTGNFWTAGVGGGAGWASGGASYFTGRDPLKPASGEAWSGIQLNWSPGLSVGSKTTASSSFLTILQKANSKTLGLNFSKSYYYMMYGNGSDKLNNGTDVSGWHFWNPIDPGDNK